MRHRTRLPSPAMLHASKHTSIRVWGTMMMDASKHSMRIALPTSTRTGMISRWAANCQKDRTVITQSRALSSRHSRQVYGPGVTDCNNTSRQRHRHHVPLHRQERAASRAPPLRRQQDQPDRRNAWFPGPRGCPGPPRPESAALHLSLESAQARPTTPVPQVAMSATLATRSFLQQQVSSKRSTSSTAGFCSFD
jgi:hypothetical protein